jgi:hypothetical protein
VAGADYAAPLIARHLTWTGRLSLVAGKRTQAVDLLPEPAQNTTLEVAAPGKRA